MYTLIYVEDIIVTGNDSKLIQKLVSQLNNLFSLKDHGDLDYFLGIEAANQADGSHTLTPSKYMCIRDLLAKTKMDEANPIASPMVGACKLSKSSSERFSDPTLYRLVQKQSLQDYFDDAKDY